VLALIERGEWDQAQRTIDRLASRNPQSRKYQAMASYALGRRAQVEHRLDEARVELQRALMIDPDLEVAKTALGELFARRR
jgi:tetratricopeptide (TPR) repeat protein